MAKSHILIGLVLFLLGFSIALLLNYNFNFEKPFLLGEGKGAISPSDYLSENEIFVYPDKVVLMISGATISNYESSGSMKPVLDKGTNGIRVKPLSEQDVKVGQIISFRYNGDLIVHRVIEKGVDENGIYFITKGDNSNFADGKIRFSDIEYITVGLIY